MVSHDLEKADARALKMAGEWSEVELLAEDFSFLAVSASTTGVVNAVSSLLGLEYPVFAGDEIMLKTMVRSNPGFMLISDGTIIGKWGFRDFPSLSELDPDLPQKIENATAPMGEEEQMLMDSGVFEGFSFDVLEFSSYVPDLVYKKGASAIEKGVVISFILGIVALLALASLISPIKL
jgi:hypothetical protein